MVSGSLSLPSSGCFSPFPHGTGSLSVSREYLALPDGPGGFAQDSSCPALLRIPLGRRLLRVRGCHPLWPLFPERSTHNCHTTAWSYNPGIALLQHRFGLVPVRSPLLGESLDCFLFLEVLRCFSSLRLPPHHVMRIITLQVIGLSHSEIRGSRDICSYPRLIAAYHVLHRLREPRHPPCALFYFRAVKPYIYNICRPCRSSACPCRTYNIYGRRLVYCFVFNFNLQSCLCQHVKDRCPDICRAGGE